VLYHWAIAACTASGTRTHDFSRAWICPWPKSVHAPSTQGERAPDGRF